MTSHHIPGGKCPKCGATLDGATNISGRAAPKAGDYSLCGECAALLRYAEGGGLREMTPAELKMIHPENRLEMEAARRLVLAMRAHFKGMDN